MSDERDERFETFLDRAAGDYNAPPPTPKEAMWARIEAARRPVPVIPLQRHARAWGWWAVAAAAALALGIGIGRWSAEEPGQAVQPVATAEGPARPSAPPVDAPPVDEPPVEPPAAPTEGPAAPSIAAADAPVAAVEPAPERRPRRAPTPAPGEAADPTALYRLASVQMLGQAEALLTSFRTGDPAAVDPQLVRWSRDVLASTRLLLDSPAAADPRMKSLLEDLELVLVQIVQLSGGRLGADERELIEETIESRDVLPRLRTTFPPGPPVLGI